MATRPCEPCDNETGGEVRKGLVGLIILGAILDLGVFAFQSYQIHSLNNLSAKTNCWTHVLDKAVAGHTPEPQLKMEAKVCERL